MIFLYLYICRQYIKTANVIVKYSVYHIITVVKSANECYKRVTNGRRRGKWESKYAETVGTRMAGNLINAYD